jgi:hypothetical protein
MISRAAAFKSTASIAAFLFRLRVAQRIPGMFSIIDVSVQHAPMDNAVSSVIRCRRSISVASNSGSTFSGRFRTAPA